MMYEIDFHRAGEGDNSGDAISLRYWDGVAWRVGVIDGGYEDTGRSVCEHIVGFYGTQTVDFVVSTHPDMDHMSGLRTILRELQVRELWMHVPAAHAASIIGLFRSRRWLVENLQTELRRAYPQVDELMGLCDRGQTQLRLPFQGDRIGPFVVLSPTIQMYEGLLPQFRDTPAPDVQLLQQLGHWLTGIGRRFSLQTLWNVFEDWHTETLREGGTTSAENESSVVLLGTFGNDRVLLTGDAGLVAMREAMRYAAASGILLARPRLFQIPHHGSRNNIAPSVLDAIIGRPVQDGQRSPVSCIVSCGKDDTTHPRQVVVNALTRRGCIPQSTREGIVCFQGNGMPARDGWRTAAALPFKNVVEAYD
jgi:beta-lactamase superfamily II metal-dependent hydrolase